MLSPERLWRKVVPATAEMRYERMALALVAACVFAFLTAQFGAIFFDALDQQLVASSIDATRLGLGLLGLTTSGFACLSLAFLLFAFIKLDSTDLPWLMTCKMRAKRVGDLLVCFAFAQGVMWAVTRIIAKLFP